MAFPDVSAHIVGDSQAMRKLREFLPKVATRDCGVLITGETGTGKEVVAQAIHCQSRRHAREMVCVNCAALPEALLESEIFGYEKGAFTGAQSRYLGKLRQAEGGTLFLDEVGDMSLQCQAKMLRAVETKQVCPLGGRGSVPIDVRIIAATNQDLQPMIECHQFRKDLFYRLNVAHVPLPPLRERKEDIPLLVRHFLDEFNDRLLERVQGLTAEVLAVLMQYDWPGNIRELRNLIEYVFIDPEELISCSRLPERFQLLTRQNDAAVPERERILSALLATNWNKSRAAHELQWSRMTLYRKLEKYRINASAPAVGDA